MHIEYLLEHRMMIFQVNDMTCGHCAAAIKTAVASVDGSATVQVDLAAKRVVIESNVTPARFMQVIENSGYTPTTAGARSGSARRAGTCCGDG